MLDYHVTLLVEMFPPHPSAVFFQYEKQHSFKYYKEKRQRLLSATLLTIYADQLHCYLASMLRPYLKVSYSSFSPI